MPRMQVYLPEELYRAVKDHGMRASELLQKAVRAELRRQEVLRKTDDYIDELIADVGQPSPQAVARADGLVTKLQGGSTRPRAV